LIYNSSMRSYGPLKSNALWFLIALCVSLFLVTLLRPQAVQFLGLTPAVLSERPWTILSNIFIHADLYHILFNMISLYFLGSFVLRAVGEKSFLAVFFLGGVAGNVLFILLADPDSTGVGASGAIFALAGALAIMVPKVPVFVFPIPVPMPLWVATLIFCLILILIPSATPALRIAWEAHLGGLLLGLLAGLIFRKRRRVYLF
jgi:uncharacterized protein